MAQFGSSLFGGKMSDVNRAFADLGRAVYGSAFRRSVEADVLAKMREVLERAAKEIDELVEVARSPLDAPPSGRTFHDGSRLRPRPVFCVLRTVVTPLMSVEPPESSRAEPAVPLPPNTRASEPTGEIELRYPRPSECPAPPPRHPAQPHPHRHRPEEHPTGRRLAVLSLTALGVVYGDIGTSPLYAIKECFKPEYGLVPTPVNVYGVLSLVVWSLMLVVSVKYVLFILRADNRGEGGVLALLALVQSGARRRGDARRRNVLIALGLIGGAFLYGDGIITPAISVLSAVEGIEIATPALAPLHRADRVRHHRRPLRRATVRYGPRWDDVRLDHADLVFLDRGDRRDGDRARTGSALGAQPVERRALLLRPPRAVVRGTGCGRSRHHRR